MTAAALLATAAGIVGVLLVAWDTFTTILRPGPRGPLGRSANRVGWGVARALARARGSRRPLTFGGPLAVALTLGLWLGVTWLSFALFYLPHLDQFAYGPGVPDDDRDVFDALYLSATAASTVGFGDIVAETDALRLLTVLQSTAGLVIITAAITYLLSITPFLRDLRRSASQATHLEALEPEGAARVACTSGAQHAAGLHAGLTNAHESIRLVPVLLYFEALERESSLFTLLRAGTTTGLVLCWGVRADGLPFAPVYGRALTLALGHLMDDYEESSPTRDPGDDVLDDEAVAERLGRLRAAVARVQPGLAQDGDDVPEDFAAFVRRAEPFLARFADDYGFERRPAV